MEKNKNNFSKLKKASIVTLAFFMSVQSNIIYADINTTSYEQNQKQRQEDRERQIEKNQRDIFIEKFKQVSEEYLKEEYPTDEVAFKIKKIEIVGENIKSFKWLNKIAHKYENQELGIKRINYIVRKMNEELVNRGYITSKIALPEQDLKSEKLILSLIAGKVKEIKMVNGKIDKIAAFPFREGDILNIRDLEQGLEQIKRVSSQDVTMKIAPAQEFGQSDIILTITKKRPIHLTYTLDDSGSIATGKMQSNIVLGIDNLVNANDILNITKAFDMDDKRKYKSNKATNIYYSIPYGKWTTTIQTSDQEFYQTLRDGGQAFRTSGISHNKELNVQYLLDRDQTSKTYLNVKLIKKDSKSYINDLEMDEQRRDNTAIEMNDQRRNTTAIEIGVNKRKYIGEKILDTKLAYKAFCVY